MPQNFQNMSHRPSVWFRARHTPSPSSASSILVLFPYGPSGSISRRETSGWRGRRGVVNNGPRPCRATRWRTGRSPPTAPRQVALRSGERGRGSSGLTSFLLVPSTALQDLCVAPLALPGGSHRAPGPLQRYQLRSIDSCRLIGEICCSADSRLLSPRSPAAVVGLENEYVVTISPPPALAWSEPNHRHWPQSVKDEARALLLCHHRLQTLCFPSSRCSSGSSSSSSFEQVASPEQVTVLQALDSQ